MFNIGHRTIHPGISLRPSPCQRNRPQWPIHVETGQVRREPVLPVRRRSGNVQLQQGGQIVVRHGQTLRLQQSRDAGQLSKGRNFHAGGLEGDQEIGLWPSHVGGWQEDVHGLQLLPARQPQWRVRQECGPSAGQWPLVSVEIKSVFITIRNSR